MTGTLEMFQTTDGYWCVLVTDKSLGEPYASGLVLFKGSYEDAFERLQYMRQNGYPVGDWEPGLHNDDGGPHD